MTVRRMNGFLARLYRVLRALRPTSLFLTLVVMLILLAQVVPAQDESEIQSDTSTGEVSDTSNFSSDCPPFDSALQHWDGSGVFYRTILENGLTVLTSTMQDVDIFALLLAGRRPCILVDKGGAIISDVALDYLSGRLSLKNLPPYRGLTFNDDPAESNPPVRISVTKTCLDDLALLDMSSQYENLDIALRRLADELTADTLQTGIFEASRKRGYHVFDDLQIDTWDSALAAFYEALLGDGHRALAGVIPGDDSLGISVDSFEVFRERYFSPENLIMTIVAPLDSSDILSLVREHLSSIPRCPQPFGPMPIPESPLAVQEVRVQTDSGRTLVVAGGLLPVGEPDNRVALEAASRILSDRLKSYLRDKRGLVGETSVTAEWQPEFGWYYIAAQSDSVDSKAILDQLRLQTEKLALDGPVGDEVSRVKEELWDSYRYLPKVWLMRVLSLMLRELSGARIPTGKEYLESLAKVDEAAVRRVAARYFRPDLWTISIFEPVR